MFGFLRINKRRLGGGGIFKQKIHNTPLNYYNKKWYIKTSKDDDLRCIFFSEFCFSLSCIDGKKSTCLWLMRQLSRELLVEARLLIGDLSRASCFAAIVHDSCAIASGTCTDSARKTCGHIRQPRMRTRPLLCQHVAYKKLSWKTRFDLNVGKYFITLMNKINLSKWFWAKHCG